MEVPQTQRHSETMELARDHSKPLELGGHVVHSPEDRGILLSGLGLTQLSLAPIGNGVVDPTRIKQVSLASNALEHLDLGPLASCVNLEALFLNGNKLSGIDLNPISSCARLEKLWLHNNYLTAIDLEPLRDCRNLKSFYIDNNRLVKGSIDLKPLENCRLLRSLRLTGNPYEGDLDISCLLSCMSLGVMEAGPSVNLVIQVPNVGQPPALPSGLRKRSVAIEWRKTETNVSTRLTLPKSTLSESHEAEDRPERFEACLAGFSRKTAIALEALLSKHALDVKVLSVEKGSCSVHGLDAILARTHVLLVSPSAEQCIRLAREYDTYLPIVLVACEAEATRVTGTCLREGADFFITEPVEDREIILVRNLAEKRSKNLAKKAGWSSPLDSLSPTSIQPSSVHRSFATTGDLPLVPDRKVDFERLRRRRYISTRSAPRSRLEESAVAMVFGRSKGTVSRLEFFSVTSLCNLPASVSDCFFSAVQASSTDGIVDDGICSSGVEFESFRKYYDAQLKLRDPDTRLFLILRRRKERVVRREALEPVVESILSNRLSEVNEIDRKRMILAASNILTQALGGSHDTLELKNFREGRFCHALMTAETGVYDGVMINLRRDLFQDMCTAFMDARSWRPTSGQEGLLDGTVAIEGLERWCHKTRSLTPYAARMVMAKANGRAGEMTYVEFSRLWNSLSSTRSGATLDYLFDIIDQDGDGVLNLRDIAPFFLNKTSAMEAEGKLTVSFGTFVNWMEDVVASGRSQSQTNIRRDGILRSAWKLVPISELSKVVSVMLYLEEDSILEDMRRVALDGRVNYANVVALNT